jgi:hypothetical protein
MEETGIKNKSDKPGVAEAGGWRPARVNLPRHYFKTKYKTKGLGMIWFKW